MDLVGVMIRRQKINWDGLTATGNVLMEITMSRMEIIIKGNNENNDGINTESMNKMTT